MIQTNLLADDGRLYLGGVKRSWIRTAEQMRRLGRDVPAAQVRQETAA
jgi:hypothetical protein